MKYIITNVNSCEVAILFPECIPHETFQNLNPISAGFCNHGQENPVIVGTWGESKGLKLKSRPEIDADIIAHCIEFSS